MVPVVFVALLALAALPGGAPAGAVGERLAGPLAPLVGAPAGHALTEADPPVDLGREQEPTVCVVAHLEAGGDSIDVELDVIRRVFLMRQRFWPSGGAAYPVNLPASSPLRERFSEAILGQSVKELASYWNERYFHGTRPPPTVASEAAVLLFVERTLGAVGYVDAGRAETLPQGVARLLCLPVETASEGRGTGAQNLVVSLRKRYPSSAKERTSGP